MFFFLFFPLTVFLEPPDDLFCCSKHLDLGPPRIYSLNFAKSFAEIESKDVVFFNVCNLKTKWVLSLEIEFLELL